jgi:hypothetical protein
MGERGAVLIIVMLVISFLTLLGVTALEFAAIELEAAGIEKGSEVALYAADAGIKWGVQDLQYTYGVGTAGVNWTTLWSNSLVNEAGCNSASCKIYDWHQLSAGSITYGTSTYRVVVSHEGTHVTEPTSPTKVYLRSLGTAPNGAQRLVEVTVAW